MAAYPVSHVPMSPCPHVPMPTPREDLPRVQNPVRIERRLDAPSRARSPRRQLEPMYGAFEKPMPCSPLIDPSSATTPSNSSPIGCGARAPSRRHPRATTMMLTWMLPSPAWPKHGIRRRWVERKRRTSSIRAGTRPRGTTTSLFELEAGDRPQARSDVSRRTRPQRGALVLVGRAQHLDRAGSAARRVDAMGLRPRWPPGSHPPRAAAARPCRPAPAALRHSHAPLSESASISSRVTGTTPRPQQLGDRAHRRGTSRNARAQRGDSRRLRDQAKRDFRDDRQRALRADQQLGREVVADDVLHRFRAGADDLPGRQHGLERQHVALRDAVLKRARTAGALGDVAADRGLLQALRIRADRTGRAPRPRPAARR